MKRRNPELLTEALTHPSAATRGPDGRREDYERLEFLGDRVLAVIVAERLHVDYPSADVGDMARRFNEMVRGETLAEVALEVGLDRMILMSGGEAQTGGRTKPAILADICEAVIAALYLDGGIEAARAFVLSHWADRIAGLKQTPRDPKSALQEWAHANGFEAPVYAITRRSGPDHAPKFVVSAQVGERQAEGRGTSKKDAEQSAAGQLLTRLEGRDD